jgi:hypothetical protein
MKINPNKMSKSNQKTVGVTANNAIKLLPNGTLIGLCDSNGVEFKTGSIVRHKNDINHDLHGTWCEYKILLQGTTPLMVYIRSEKGLILPIGYTACCLSNFYDLNLFVFSENSMDLRPEENLIIQNL